MSEIGNNTNIKERERETDNAIEEQGMRENTEGERERVKYRISPSLSLSISLLLPYSPHTQKKKKIFCFVLFCSITKQQWQGFLLLCCSTANKKKTNRTQNEHISIHYQEKFSKKKPFCFSTKKKEREERQR